MRIFISQPMTGREDADIQEERGQVEAYLRRKFTCPLEFVGYHKDGVVTNQDQLYCLSEAVKLLSEVDAVYFTLGWHTSKGCISEHTIASLYGIKIIGEQMPEEFPFEDVLPLLKLSKHVRRRSWKEGIEVVYMHGYPEGVPCNEVTAVTWGLQKGSPFRLEPYFQINTVDGAYTMWSPTLQDILADDWSVV